MFIARSIMKFEIIILENKANEVEWLRNFLEDIPCWLKYVHAIMIYCEVNMWLQRHNIQCMIRLDIFVVDTTS